MYSYLKIIFIIPIILNTLFAQKLQKNSLDSILTKEEKTYLKDTKVLTVCVKKNWLPYESYENNKFIGISADFLNLYAKKLNIKLKIIPFENQFEFLRWHNTNICDIKPVLVQSNKQYINYIPTKSYLTDNISLVTRLDKGYIKDLNNLHNVTLLATKGFKLFQIFIENNYPHIKLKFINTTEKAFKMIIKKKAFGYLGTSLTSSYLIQKEFSTKLKISNSFKEISFGFGINEKNKILKNILDKAIQTTSIQEKNMIYNRWLYTTMTKETYDYTYIWYIIIISLTIVSILLYRNYLIASTNKRLHKKIKEAIKKNELQHKQLVDQAKFVQMGEMISMIAHQWRQPLAAIGASSTSISIKAARGKLSDEKAIELSSAILTYLQHLSATIDDFRDFFKPTKKQKDTNYTRVVEETLKIIEVSIESNKIKVIKELNSDKEFHTYPNELKQVLLNLIKNSIDALLENNIVDPYIKIETHDNMLKVSDNGGGIPQNIINKIFDPYFSTKLEKNGTGLGLYMSKMIIEEHCNGKLQVSNDTNGAIFTITLKPKDKKDDKSR